MITVCTARLTYGGPGRLDITWRGAYDARGKGLINDGEIYAPSTELRQRLCREEISPSAYMLEYEVQLEREWTHPSHSIVIRSHLSGDLGARLVGVCYCAEDERGRLCCHRTVWRLWLASKGAIDGGELPAEEQRRVVTAKPSRQGSLF